MGGWARVLVCAVGAVVAGCEGPVRVERQWTFQDRRASAEVFARTDDVARKTLEDIAGAFERAAASVDGRPGSALGELNREAPLGWHRVADPDFFRCLQTALRCARATEGAFDPTVGPLTRLYGSAATPDPDALSAAAGRVGWRDVELIPDLDSVHFRRNGMEIDLSGIFEGHALDVAVRSFARVGCLAGLVRLGDGVYAWNRPPESAAWTIEFPRPDDPSRTMFHLDLANRAASTCTGTVLAWTARGAARAPLVDPSTGRPPATDVVSATAVSSGGAEADALSRGLWIGGSRRAAGSLQGVRRAEAVLLVRTGAGPALWASGSLKGRLRVDPAFEASLDGRVRYLLPPRDRDR